MLLNIMTLGKKKKNNKGQQQGRTDAFNSPVVCPSSYAERMALFNVTVLRVSRWFSGTREQRRNIVGNEGRRTCFRERGNN